MKEYIRSTHDFDNEKREWVYRGSRGEDKHIEWNTEEYHKKTRERQTKWSFGVHCLDDSRWMSLRSIIDETIDAFKGHASDNTEEFLELQKTNPNYRDVIKQDILKEFEYLIEMDLVRVRERPTYDTKTDEFWSS